MMKWIFPALFFFCFSGVSAQSAQDSVELEVHVGDSIEIGSCKGASYMHLDYFKKTRWVGVPKPYDTATGDGFYASFFKSGDFDMYKLPKSFKGKTFAVMGLEVLNNSKTGKHRYVMYLRGTEPNSVIWVDFYEAVEAGEIKFVRYRF